MTANGLASEKTYVEKSPAKDYLTAPNVSDLHFMGIPLGTDCDDLKNFENSYNYLGKPSQLEHFRDRYVGYTKLFGETFRVQFGCRLGKFVQGEIDIDRDFFERFQYMLEEKYGKRNLRYDYGWDLGNGKTIKLDTMKKTRFIFADEKLFKTIEREEALKEVNKNKNNF